MASSLARRVVFARILGVIAGLCLCTVPMALQAQTTNHPPLITSQPATGITAGSAYQYTLTGTDRDNDTVTFKLTSGPNGLTLSGTVMSWQPNAVGTYNVIVQAADSKGGYDSQSWQIQVLPDILATLVISPNDRPTIVDIGTTKQFTVAGFDQFQNIVSAATITWSTDQKIGSVTANGVFTATRGGTGFVATQSGDIKASVGVIVKDTRKDQVTLSNTNTNTNTQGTATSTVNNSANKSATSNTNSNANTNQQEIMSQQTNTNSATTDVSTTSQPCTNPNHKLIVSLLIIYAIVLIIYYMYERRHRSSGWWIFPFLLTFIGLIVFFKYFCPGTYLWWPWVLVAIGVIITVYYKIRRSAPDIHQTELPF